MRTAEAIEKLMDAEGVSEEVLMSMSADSVNPAICLDCGSTTEMEPDCVDGPCQSCGNYSVASSTMLFIWRWNAWASNLAAHNLKVRNLNEL